MTDLGDRIRIVLNRPQHPGNVGAAARAMKNMGLRRLRLVSPCDHHSDLAEWMAVSARDILRRAEVYDDLAAALSGSSLVIGTVPPDRKRFSGEVLRPKELGGVLRTFSSSGRVSILFGPEDHGLSNRELDLCQAFLCIPSSPDFPSLNLAQAVMVVAYEIHVSDPVGENDSLPRRNPADFDSLEGMYCQLQETLAGIGFLNRENPSHIMRDFRRIFGRARLDEREIRILRGMFRQIQWAAGARNPMDG